MDHDDYLQDIATLRVWENIRLFPGVCPTADRHPPAEDSVEQADFYVSRQCDRKKLLEEAHKAYDHFIGGGQ